MGYSALMTVCQSLQRVAGFARKRLRSHVYVLGIFALILGCPSGGEAQSASQQFQLLVQKEGDHLNQLRRLLKHGANINYHEMEGTNETFYTPLQYAVELKKTRVIRFLLRHGANPNPRGLHDERFMTPLMIAVYCSLPTVKLLVKYGAKVNPRRTYHDETPLMYACYVGNYEIVKYLLRHGADVQRRDLWGKTARDHVHGVKQAKIVFLLKRYEKRSKRRWVRKPSMPKG